MREKQSLGANLPSIEETNQTRSVKMPVESKDRDLSGPSASLEQTLHECDLGRKKEG